MARKPLLSPFPKMIPPIPFDDVAWEASEEISDYWLHQFLNPETTRPIGTFMMRYAGPDKGILPRMEILEKGSFNITIRMQYKYSAHNIRFPQPGAIIFSEEKVKIEVDVMRYIADQTSIPVPFIFRSGSPMESLLFGGPFILMNHIEHTKSMYEALNTPGRPKEERGILDPDMDEDKLKMLYKQLAKILLQLYQPDLPKVGALEQINDFDWEVTRRPLSMNMNELVRLGTLPRSKLPFEHTTYDTASSYFEALVEINVQHLIHQRNDAIQSENDCRRKYVARRLFQKLTKEKKLASPADNGPFKLWCDDFRPANVLLNGESNVAGVIDWEFTYAAPVEFSHAPPWWLLIERPDKWPEGLENWTEEFDRRLKTFLTAMKECEDDGHSRYREGLSENMARSWRSGDFWIVYVLLNSFAFDAIYWEKIDKRFFGHAETGDICEVWKERLHLLDEDEVAEMERLVKKKMGQFYDRVLAWDVDHATEGVWREMESKKAAGVSLKEEFTKGADEVDQMMQVLRNLP